MNKINIHYDIYLVNLSLFLTYIVTLYWLNDINIKSTYSILTVTFTISLFYVILFNYLYFTHTTEFLEFTGSDSRMYDMEGRIASQYGIIEGIKYYMVYTGYGIGESAMVIYLSLIYRFIDHPLVPNIGFVLINLTTVFLILSISKEYMSEKLSNMSAILYGTASFSIYYQSSLLKETFFVFTVMLVFYFYQKYTNKRSSLYILLTILSCFALMIFRLPLVIFVIVSIIIAELVKSNLNFKSLIYVIIAFVTIVIFFNFYESSIIRFTRSVNPSLYIELANVDFQTLFGITVIAGIFGPFPTYIPINGTEDVSMFAVGLTFKVFLSLFFIYSIRYIIKERDPVLIAMYIFCILHIASLIFLAQTFKTRYFLPYAPLLFILSFFCIDKLSKSKSFIFKYYLFIGMGLLIFIILWNVLRI